MSDSNEATKKNQKLQSNKKMNEAAERSRLYRERYRKEIAERMRLYREKHREKINQRRKEKKQQQLLQIFTASNADNADVEENLQETSIYEQNLKAHSQRQHRYYETHKEEINKRRREKRQKQSTTQKIPATTAERNRSYREKNRQLINERRRHSRRLKQNSFTECNNELDAIEFACLNDEIKQEVTPSSTSTPQQHNKQHIEEIKTERGLTTMEALQKTEETLQDYKMIEKTGIERNQAESSQPADLESDDNDHSESHISINKPRGSQSTKEMREELLKIEQRKLQILEAKVAQSAALMKSDNYQFLMSLLSEMEKLPSVHKMRLRMKISQAVLDEVSSLEQGKIKNIQLIHDPDLSVDIKEESNNMYLPTSD